MNEDALFNLGFALGMVAMWVIQRVIRAWKDRNIRKRQVIEMPADEQRRTEEIESLHARLAVLERIATDPAERTAREIEALR